MVLFIQYFVALLVKGLLWAHLFKLKPPPSAPFLDQFVKNRTLLWKNRLFIYFFTGPVGCTFTWTSVICLTVHIFIYTAIRKLRTPAAQNLLALTCALCPAQFFNALGLTYTTSRSICIFIATCLHYFYLVAAFWMNVLHFDLCRVCFERSILKKVRAAAKTSSEY